MIPSVDVNPVPRVRCNSRSAGGYRQQETWMDQTLHKLYSWFTLHVWDDDLRDLHGLHKAVVFIARVLHMLLRELLGGQLNLRAMSLVYTTLLSVVPLLAVSFSVLKGLGVHTRIEPFLYELMTPLGPQGVEVADRIVGFVENIRVGVLGSLGFAFLIYTVISLLQKIESAFNFVWQVERMRSISQRFSSYLSVVLIGPVLIFSAIGLAATVLDTELAQRLIAIEPLGTLIVYSGQLIPYFLVCLAFTFVYMFIPNTRVQLRAALTGGVIGGALWATAGWGFATFIASSSKYAAVYSSFAILILLLIWLYLNWLIMLVGSQIAYFVQYPKYMTLHRVRFVLSNRVRERLALQIMYLAGYSFYHGGQPWNLDALVERLGLPGEPVHRVIEILVNACYLIEVTSEEAPVYLPVHDIAGMRLYDLLAAVRRAGEDRFLNDGQLPPIGAVDLLMSQVDGSYRNITEHRTVKDLVLGVDEEMSDRSPGEEATVSLDQ